MTVFIPHAPVLKNQFLDDEVLKDYLEKITPVQFKDIVFSDLERFGEDVTKEILNLANEAEMDQPKFIDENHIEISNAWKELHKVCAKEGLIAIGQDKRFGSFARTYQFAKKYLFNSSSAYYSCPLAMTDGALKLLTEIKSVKPKELEEAICNLTSTDPEKFWSSGQWMTEQKGGSDVSNTETIAKFENDEWNLYGLKWFTSAVDSQMALTLAKPEGHDSLQLFFVKTYDQSGKLNNIKIKGLKNKLGTKALPTAELELCGTKAIPIGNAGEGVKLISKQFNVTRIHNALECVSSMRRQIALLQSYAEQRIVFGKELINQPLFDEVFSEIKLTHKKCFLFTMKVVQLLGLSEDNPNDELVLSQLRLLTPILKLYTAKKNITLSSEVLESFGGVGYIEDSGIPKFYRDAQVLSIWEGTTNVLSLDFLRALKRTPLTTLKDLMYEDDYNLIEQALRQNNTQDELERNSRKISFLIGDAICNFLLKDY